MNSRLFDGRNTVWDMLKKTGNTNATYDNNTHNNNKETALAQAQNVLVDEFPALHLNTKIPHIVSNPGYCLCNSS